MTNPCPCRPPDGPRRPRVLHVVNTLDGGGMERMLVSLVRATAGDRLDHVVCALRGPGELADRLPAGVPLEPLHARNGESRTFLRLAQVIRRYRVDVVHARGCGIWSDTALACALTRRPVILGFHGLQNDTGFTLRQRRRSAWLPFVCRRFVSVSYAGRTQLERELAIPAHRVEVIPNGVSADRFAPPTPSRRDRTRMSLGVPPSACVVGTVGSLTPVKDHAALVEAVAACRAGGADVRLLIVGDGPLGPDLRGQAHRLAVADATIFVGVREDIPDLLGAIDLYVSSSRSEGVSNAILEAMCTGLCVIATRVGDNARLLEEGRAGVLVPPHDPTILGREILALADAPARRKELGAQARRQVLADYTFDNTVERYVELYRRVGVSAAGGRQAAQMAMPLCQSTL